MNNENLLKEDLVKMVQDAKKNSFVDDVIYIPGEMYVSEKTKKKKKKDSKLKKGIIGIVACAAVITTLGAEVVIADTMDFATEVKEEINDNYAAQNIIGGQYFEKYEHDKEFRDYANDLNSFQLTNLFNETSEEMQNNGMINGANNIEEVVDQMEENYLENSGKSK